MKWSVHLLCLDLGQRVLSPLAEQSRIVTRVAQLRRLCADLRQCLTASQSTQAHPAEALVQDVE
jgi:type I restriction enzyme S subunit